MSDLEKDFILQTDASERGVGAALLQKYREEICPVVCASKQFLPRDQKNSTIERECLAIFYGVKNSRIICMANNSFCKLTINLCHIYMRIRVQTQEFLDGPCFGKILG